jgi:site-specific DNA recombinase
VGRVPADKIETAVIDNLRVILRAPEIVVETWRTAASSDPPPPESVVREALEKLDALWDELFPAEQARIVQLLVERVDLDVTGMNIRLCLEGLHSVAEQIRNQPGSAAC